MPIPLGAPGIYEVPVAPLRVLTGLPMDVTAFLGVAPRGPAREPLVDERWRADVPATEPGRPRLRSVPVAVESWDEYRRLFGGFEGQGLLPYAVAAFFENGGRRAWIVRIVHDFDGPLDRTGVARARLVELESGGVPVKVRARNEGTWGNKLRATLSFAARPLLPIRREATELAFPLDVDLPARSLLRLELPDATRVLRIVTATWEQGAMDSWRRERVATLDRPLAADPVGVELVEATLEIDDGDGRAERLERVGLDPGHPRFLATVLSWESELLSPDPKWAATRILPIDSALPSAATRRFRGGRDRSAAITPEDFFDPRWVPEDEEPRDGLHSLVGIEDVSLVCVPDLYSPVPLDPFESIVDPGPLASDEFAQCIVLPDPPAQPVPASELEGLRLELPLRLDKVTALQLRVEDLAMTLREWIVLLDVPPGLSQRAILDWRSQFSSSFAAAYHPWLRVARRDDSRDALVRVPPSAFAAGMAARRERLLGLPYAPSSELTAGVADVDERVSPQRHDELQPNAVNVFVRERDGVRLSAARTLSRDADLRQLSVRRLLTMLKRVLERRLQWMVFEPNGPQLRREVEHTLRSFLRQLYQANAFAGASEQESFFVHCDDRLNPPAVVDAGRLVAEIGVAPAEPLEFLVLRVARDGEGVLAVEDGNA